MRPADYSLPYSTMEKNSVAFSAVDKRSNKLLTVMVRVPACGDKLVASGGHKQDRNGNSRNRGRSPVCFSCVGVGALWAFRLHGASCQTAEPGVWQQQVSVTDMGSL